MVEIQEILEEITISYYDILQKNLVGIYLHNSDYQKDKYLNQLDYICGNLEDPDLAAHIVILRERGICERSQITILWNGCGIQGFIWEPMGFVRT